MIPEAPGPVAMIDNTEALTALVGRLLSADWVALDTEFVRERTYYPQLCLIQLAGPTELACVDPLAVANLAPLNTLLADPSVTKILHAAVQDLEILLQATGTMPTPIFDTQVAAAMLGHPDQIGYAKLVATELGHELAKAHTRTDWSQRPLSQAQIDYAADDVRYLAAMYPRLREQLAKRGRLDWLAAESAAMTEPARYTPDPARAWQRIKGVHKLKPSQQQALARLAEWRENTAIEQDRPRRWIVKDDPLLELARKRPNTAEDLARMRDLPAKTSRRHGEALLACIQAARQAPAEALVADKPQLSAQQQAVTDMLMSATRAQAEASDINVGTLTSRKELEQLARGERDLAVTQGWRRSAIGQTLLDVLDGHITLRVGANGIELHNAQP